MQISPAARTVADSTTINKVFRSFMWWVLTSCLTGPAFATAPTPPGTPVAELNHMEAYVRFDAPESEGSSPVTGYTVESHPAGGVDTQAGSTSRFRRITGLTLGPHYTFTVRASNASGTSLPSAPSNSVHYGDPSAKRTLHTSGTELHVQEGDTGIRPVVMVATLSAPMPDDIVFNLKPGYLAQPFQDFDPSGLTDLSIPAGELSTSFEIRIFGDHKVENSEIIRLNVENIRGGNVRGSASDLVIVNDDVAGEYVLPLEPLSDRFVVQSGGPALELDILRNDDFHATELVGPVEVTVPPTLGAVVVLDNGTPDFAADDRLLYTPGTGHGEDSFEYRLCEEAVCERAMVSVQLRPLRDIDLMVNRKSGHIDIASSLPNPAAALEFIAGPLVRPHVLEPVTDHAQETLVGHWLIPAPADGERKRWRILVDARVIAGEGPIKLIAGRDKNGDGQVGAEEIGCYSSTRAAVERCELVLDQPGDEPVGYWVTAYSYRTAARLRAEVFQVPVSTESNGLVATSASRLAAGESFPLRLSWDDPTLLDGEARAAYVQMRVDGSDRGMFPVRIDAPTAGRTPIRLVPGKASKLALSAGEIHDRVFFDVPANATGVTVSSQSASEVDFYVARQETPLDAGSSVIGPAPSVGSAAVLANAPGGTQSVQVPGTLAPGRWYVVPHNASATIADLTLTVTIDAMAPSVRSGSYFNAGRSGHGVFLYPAGNELAGLWYTYLPDGTSTWYYLQGPSPGTNGVWTTPVYRSVWDGSRNRLTTIGQAVVTPMGPDAFSFSYSLDGETGSEPMASLGRGCPRLGGLPQDLSSHWFNPARAGTGYSVQMWPGYEYYAAFVYDRQGIARFLTAERNGFGGATATLDLEQLTGFCPTCERTGSPTRTSIGTFRRTISGGAISRIEMDGIYTGGVPGVWEGNEAVQTLGGPGTTQGCGL